MIFVAKLSSQLISQLIGNNINVWRKIYIVTNMSGRPEFFISTCFQNLWFLWVKCISMVIDKENNWVCDCVTNYYKNNCSIHVWKCWGILEKWGNLFFFGSAFGIFPLSGLPFRWCFPVVIIPQNFTDTNCPQLARWVFAYWWVWNYWALLDWDVS